MILEHDGIKLEFNNRKTAGKSKNIGNKKNSSK